MAIPTPAEFLAMHQDFSGYTPETIQAYINDVGVPQCPTKVWVFSGETVAGLTQKNGIRLYVAHTLEMQRREQAIAAGAAAGAAKGDGSANPTAQSDDLDLTSYGRQFKALRSTLPTTTGFAL